MRRTNVGHGDPLRRQRARAKAPRRAPACGARGRCARIVLDAARKLAFPLPLAAAAHQLYLATAAAGHGNEDDAAVVKFYAELAGLELPAKKA